MSLSESTKQLLARLGFEPNHESPEIPSWRATREGRGIAAVLFEEPHATLALFAGGDNVIDAHLVVDPRGGPFRLGLSTGMARPQPTHTTGDAAFDARFEVFSYANGGTAVPVMLDDAVRRGLLELPARVTPRLNGASLEVHVPLGDPAEEAALIEGMMPTLWSLGLAIDDASRKLPMPSALRPFFDAFERAATERAMTLRRNALCAKKTDGGASVHITWRTAKSDIENLAIELPPAGVEILVGRESGLLPGGPRLRPADSLRRQLVRLFAGREGTGDGAFDRKWIFNSDDPAEARKWLRADVRDALEALRAAGFSVEVYSGGVIAKGPLPKSDALVPSLTPHLDTLLHSMSVASTPFRGP